MKKWISTGLSLRIEVPDDFDRHIPSNLATKATKVLVDQDLLERALSALLDTEVKVLEVEVR